MRVMGSGSGATDRRGRIRLLDGGQGVPTDPGSGSLATGVESDIPSLCYNPKSESDK